MIARRRLLHDLRLVLGALWVVVRVRLDLTLRRHTPLRTRIATVAARRILSAEGRDADLAEVAWSVSAASRLVPGASCLTQASAGQLLLARRGCQSIVRLSLPHGADQEAGFRPHAWLIASGRILLGGTVADYAQHRILCDFLPEGREITTQPVAA